MKKQLIAVLALCATCLVAQGQGSPDSSSASGSTDKSSSGASGGSSDSSPGSSSSSGYKGSGLSATGRGMSHRAIQASKLNNCNVQGTSGETLGTIQDVVINPISGKVDFAIVSLNSADSSSSTSSTTPATGSSSGKQVAVPWSLLRPSSAGGISGSSSSTSGAMGPNFTFSGDTSKLQSAPTFDSSSDLNQPSWRQSVFSYFGVSGGSATGGSEYPSSGSSSGSTSSAPDSSSSSNPDSSTSKP